MLLMLSLYQLLLVVRGASCLNRHAVTQTSFGLILVWFNKFSPFCQVNLK